MECKLFQTSKHEKNYTVWKKTPTGFKLSQYFSDDGQNWVTRTFRQANIKSTIYQRFGVGFERYRIFFPLSRVSILFPCLDLNKILLPGQLSLSYEFYFQRSRQEFLAPLYIYVPGRDNTSCTQLHQNKRDMTLTLVSFILYPALLSQQTVYKSMGHCSG